jgi:DNA-binding response OmpR family regulator
MSKHIVLIEDDADLLDITGLVLEQNGYRVTRLPALISYEELVSLNANCFIIDENLPGISGHIICILLKSKEATKHIPVILTSAGTKLDLAAELCEADAVIKKPYEIDEKLATINTVLVSI